jgi:hypothetical protein
MARIAHSLSFCYVGGLKPFRALDYVERYPFTFSEGFEAIGGNGGEMTKDIFTMFLRKKTKPFAVVEPFYRSSYRVLIFS